MAIYRLEVLQLQERNIHTLIVSVDSLEDPTSTCKREEMLNQAVVYIAKLEDITGPKKPSEEEEPVVVDADTSDTLQERRRMVTELEPRPRRWSKSECDGHLTFKLYQHIRNRIIINMTKKLFMLTLQRAITHFVPSGKVVLHEFSSAKGDSW